MVSYSHSICGYLCVSTLIGDRLWALHANLCAITISFMGDYHNGMVLVISVIFKCFTK